MPQTALQDRIKELLSAPDSPHVKALLELTIEGLLDQPASLGLSADEVTGLVLAALTEGNTARFLERYLAPGLLRTSLRLAQSTEQVGELLPEAARLKLPELIAAAEGPRFAWLGDAITPSDLRELLAPVLQKMLIQFASKLPIPGLSGSGPLGAGAQGLGNLMGMLGKQMQKSARDLAEVGRNVVSGISSELDRRLQTIAHDFSQGASAELRAAVEERMASPEGKVIIGRMRERFLQHVLAAQLKDVGQDLASAPVGPLGEILPQIVAHLPQQGLIRAAVEAEVRAALATLGARSLRELLDEAGLLTAAREQLRKVFAPVLAATLAGPGFARFLSDLLTDAGA